MTDTKLPSSIMNKVKPFTASTLTTTKQYLVVFISSPTCGPCKKFAPLFNEWSNQYDEFADFYKGDITDEMTEEIIIKHNVTKVPTFLILKREGELVKKFIGSDGETLIKNVLNCTFIKQSISSEF